MDAVTRAELAGRWAYRAELEHTAAARFRRLADRLEAEGFDRELVAIARLAVEQERDHVRLCAEIAERFGDRVELPAEPALPEIAPASFGSRDRAVYEVVAFCCITETANAAVVTAGADDIDDTAIRKAVRTILADEVQHSRLGWRFLATHELTDDQRAWIGGYLPHMLKGTVREDLFKPVPIVGDELTMQKYGTLPVAGRRQAFLDGMREVLIPGLDPHGIDTSLAAQFLDELEASIG
ncbi:MAG TPA: ferritin-like domain-containing protein [Kofleriaceae bacterium]|nr:ferritin-like domain-containing protein [Kofleriaceae bacterium]